MNYKTLIIGAVIIFILAIVAALTIPDRINNENGYQDDDSYAEENEEYEEMYENENEDTEMYDEDSQTEAPYGDKGGDSTSQATTETTASGYTLVEVATHNSEESCWTAINNQVYDLTPFIRRHPGGSANIMKLCGIDGTATFTAQHGGQSRPESTLADYLVGPLI